MPESPESRFLNLHEFVTQARTNLDRNNWDYLISGSETETTLARNRLALDAIDSSPENRRQKEFNNRRKVQAARRSTIC